MMPPTLIGCSPIYTPRAACRNRTEPPPAEPSVPYDIISVPMEMGCADCGCIVDSGVVVVTCGKRDCCCQHLSAQS